MPTDPAFEKIKALLDPIIATLPTVASQKPFEPVRMTWLNKTHSSFVAESGKTMQDPDCPGVLLSYEDDMHPNNNDEVFVACYDWAGSRYKWLANCLADAFSRAGYSARVTTKKKSLGVAVKVDAAAWYA